MNSPLKPLSDRIREFTLRTVIRPAVKANEHEITIRAGDVHSAMQLRDRMPAVCSALASKAFQEMCGLELVHRRGPHRGANVYLTFARAGSLQPPASSQSAKPPTLPRETSRSKTAQNVKIDPDTLYLVACVKTKRKARVPAKDLYTSALFTKARAYAEANGGRWQILSAKYGLVDPAEVIDPYELTLNKMGVVARKQWATGVLEALSRLKPRPKQIVMLAGTKYRENLIPELQQQGIDVVVPMEGLAFGEQLSWLGSH